MSVFSTGMLLLIHF